MLHHVSNVSTSAEVDEDEAEPEADGENMLWKASQIDWSPMSCFVGLIVFVLSCGLVVIVYIDFCILNQLNYNYY